MALAKVTVGEGGKHDGDHGWRAADEHSTVHPRDNRLVDCQLVRAVQPAALEGRSNERGKGELHSARRFEDGRFEVTPVRPLGAQAAREGGREGGAKDAVQASLRPVQDGHLALNREQLQRRGGLGDQQHGHQASEQQLCRQCLQREPQGLERKRARIWCEARSGGCRCHREHSTNKGAQLRLRVPQELPSRNVVE